MTIEQSLKFIEPILNKLQQNIDFTCTFHMNGKIKNIRYDSATKTLSEPFPEREELDDNKIFIIPHNDLRPVKIVYEKFPEIVFSSYTSYQLKGENK